MDQLTKLGPFAGLAKLWKDLSNPQRVVVSTFAIMSVMVVVLIAIMATKPSMSVLFSGLESEDAGAIVEKLSEKKIPYKISADGTAIEVPSDKVYELKMEMATEGLPQGGGAGFELFDKTSFGMTEFTEKVTYQRAIQGELRRTITTLAPVNNARIHITIPDDKLYASEQQPAKASIALELKRGRPLTDEQVGGIVHLVASAVDGLKPENVAVVDSQGNMLSETLAAARGTGSMLTSNQSKLKRTYETELAQNLQSMLARIVGPDKAVVRVSADLDFDQKQMKSETYEPLTADEEAGPKGVVLSEDKTTESYNGNVIPPGGLPIGEDNVTGDSYTRTESSTRYEVTKRIEEVVSAPGQVERLSVAVLIDKAVDKKSIPAIQQAVTAAAGIDETRGDQITVQTVAFDTTAQKQMAAEMKEASKNEFMTEVAKTGGAVLLLVIFLLFLRKIVRQIKVPVPQQLEPEQAGTIPSPEELQNLAGLLEDARSSSSDNDKQAELVGVGAGVNTASMADSELPQEISQSSPEDLARLVRTWMNEP